MQSRRAIRNRAGAPRSDRASKLLLESRDFRSLRNPAGKNNAPDRFGFGLAQKRFGDGDDYAALRHVKRVKKVTSLQWHINRTLNYLSRHSLVRRRKGPL